MKIRAILLISLILSIGGISPLQAGSKLRSVAQAGIALATLYGLCYGATQLASYNKPITVDVVDAPAQKPTHSEENYLFAHGIAETHEQAYWYTKGKSSLPYLIDGRLFTYDYPDATSHFWRVNFTQTGLGQHNEIEGLKNAYEQAVATLDASESAHKKMVLIGLSRGASTILNFMGLHKPENVKAIIAESPFDSTRTITKNILGKLDRIPGMQTIGHAAISAVFWQHSIKGIQPIDTVCSIDTEIPLLFVCSQQDTLIPAKSTIALYKKLKDNGHEKVHIFIADHGRHGRILHGPDGESYQQLVHAYYKEKGLKHDPALAEAGAPLFAQSQPDF